MELVQFTIDYLQTRGYAVPLEERQIYQDEMIPGPDSSTDINTEQRLKALIRMKNGIYYAERDVSLFYRQAKYMESFDGSFDKAVPSGNYYNVYASMSLRELRAYFSWRTEVRHGRTWSDRDGCARLYYNELINLIGCSTPMESYQRLKAYMGGGQNNANDHYEYIGQRLLRDMIVYYGLDVSLYEYPSPVRKEQLILKNFDGHSSKEVFQALSRFSSYKLNESRFYLQYPDDVEDVAGAVYAAVSKYYGRTQNGSYFDRIFGPKVRESYDMFSGLMLYESRPHPDCGYQIDELTSFQCKDGHWYRDAVPMYLQNADELGALMRNIDYQMRAKYAFRSALRSAPMENAVIKLIDAEIDQLLQKKREAARPKVEIDVTKLQEIRDTALRTQTRLLADETEPPLEKQAAPQSQQPLDERVIPEPEASNIKEGPLNELETAFLRALLTDQPYAAMLRSKGLLPSVTVDAINEKLFERLEDTAIEWEGDKPKPVEDYIDTLKEICGL